MIAILHTLAYTASAFWLLTAAGNWACRRLLDWLKVREVAEQPPGDARPAGWVIGGLERLILALGFIAGSWEILAAVIALKTVARFKELDDKIPAEYFLIGSLFSVLWAMLVSGAWLIYDHGVGHDLHGSWVNAMGVEGKAEKP